MPAKAEVTSITAAHMANISGLIDVPKPSAASASTSKNRTPENSPARKPPSPHFLADKNAPTNAEINSAASASGAEDFSGVGQGKSYRGKNQKGHRSARNAPKRAFHNARKNVIIISCRFTHNYLRDGFVLYICTARTNYAFICFRCFRRAYRLSFLSFRLYQP